MQHINAHCGKEDPLYPLVAFFNHNYRRIDRMSHKRYDSTNYRQWRELTPSRLAEPALIDTVAPIVWFLQREAMVQPSPSPLVVEHEAGLLNLEPSS
jgi:hypothetical protein